MSGPIVPKFTTNGTVPLPIGIEELVAHLDQMDADPLVAPNQILFDNIEIQLTETTSLALLPSLLPRLSSALSYTTHDPTPLTSLLERLLRPIPFDAILGLAPPDSLVAALSSPSPPANLLGLALVRKAASDARSAAILARDNMSGVLNALLKLWMEAPGADVGNGAGKIVLALLERDSTTLQRVKWGDPVDGAARNSLPPLVGYEGAQGTGELWVRFFEPAPVPLIVKYLLPLLSSSTQQTSLAQDRLLRIAPQLAALSLPDLTRKFDLGAGVGQVPSRTSVLEICAKSVDVEDMLIVSCLADFFENLVCLLRLSPWAEHDSMAEVRALVRDARERIGDVKQVIDKIPLRVIPEEQDGVSAWTSTL